MKAIEFEAAVDSQGMIAVPEEYKTSLPGKKMKVIVLYEEEDEWKQLTTEQLVHKGLR